MYMRHIFRYIQALLVIAGFSLLASESSAQFQWQKIFTAPNRVAIIYFYNSDLGFIGIGVPSGSSLAPAIFRTADGGISWKAAQTPHGSGFGVNDILMEDELNGWAGSDNHNGHIWQTTDGGKSWNALSQNETDDRITNSVRKTKQGLIITDFLGGDIELSGDGGHNFHKVYSPGDYVLGMDFADSVHGAAITNFRSSHPWTYTADGGLTWHSSNFGIESWTLKAMKGSSVFLAIPEGRSDVSDYASDVMRSDDFGAHWRKIRTLDFRSTSDLEIDGKDLYIQTSTHGCISCSYPDGVGIYRSTDSGMTWHGIGGPDYWNDTRFAVIRTCQGTAVICSDIHNNIYKIIDTSTHYIDTTDGHLHTRITVHNSPNLSTCGIGEADVRITEDPCEDLIMQQIEIQGKYSEWFNVQHSPLPEILSGSSDSIHITIHPKDTGSITVYLHISGYFDYGEKGKIAYDTLFPLTIKVLPGLINFGADKHSVVFTVSECKERYDATISLTNQGCDTISIVGGPGNTAPFIFDSVDLPIKLPPGYSKDVGVHFTAGSVLPDTAWAIFHAASPYEGEEQVITLIAQKENKKPALLSDFAAVAFPQLYLCEGMRTSRLRLTNPGCDTIRILSANTLIAGFVLDSISFPVILPPGASFETEVVFAPILPGTYIDTLFLQLANQSEAARFRLPLAGVAKVNPLQIDVTASKIDFHTVSTCDNAVDSVMVLRNVGCDTIRLSLISLTLPKEFIMSPSLLPAMLAPHDSTTLRFTFHPSGNGNFTADIKLQAERFGEQLPVEFSLQGEGVQGLGIMTSSPEIFPFPQATICSGPDSLGGMISNTGCDSLVIDNVILSESGAFMLSPLKLPCAIAPNSEVHYTAYSFLREKGIHTATIFITSHASSESSVTYQSTIPLSATVTDGIRTCSLDRSEIDFGSQNLCAEPDSQIVITNTGCDTITISSAQITGSGYLLHDISFPISIAPRGRIEIPILSRADTSGKSKVVTGTLTLESNALQSISPVTLWRKNLYPAEYDLYLGNDVKSGKPGDTIELRIYSDGDLTGLESIDFDLDDNFDMLGFVKASGMNQVNLTAQHVHISGSPSIGSENGTLATLAFQVFLTRDSATDIIISNPHLNISQPFYEACTATARISEGRTRFVSAYSCGEQTISQTMNGILPLSIKGIYPNPARKVLTIDLHSDQDGTVFIYDMMGRQQLRKEFVGNTSPVSIELSSLSSGEYVARVISRNSEMSVPFIKKE